MKTTGKMTKEGERTMGITTLLLLCVSLIVGFSTHSAEADIVTVQPGEILRLTFTAPFPENCLNPDSFPGIPPAPCNALSFEQDSGNRVTPVGVLVTGRLFEGAELLGIQTTDGCAQRGPTGACNGFLFRFPVDTSGILDGILDLTFSAPVDVDLSATRFGLIALVVDAQGSGFIGFFVPILSAALLDSTFLPVAIDIKPGSFPNSINPRSRGVIPVAILSDDNFDVTTVNPTTIRFGPTGIEAAPVRSALEDVDKDGDTDMVFHFRTQEIAILCGDTSALLTGETKDGQAFDAFDSVRTVGCK